MKINTYMKNIIILISGLLVLILILVLSGVLNNNVDYSKYKVAYFEEPPIILNCKNSSYSEEDVNNAVKFWKNLDYEFGIIIDNFNCNNVEIEGTIMIKPAGTDFPFDHMGLTTTIINSESKIIQYAKIEILDDRERVLEHELGHAIGFEHINEVGNMMNEDWYSGGWGTNGLFNNFY